MKNKQKELQCITKLNVIKSIHRKYNKYSETLSTVQESQNTESIAQI